MSYRHMILGRALVAGLNQPRRTAPAHSPSEQAAFERAGERKTALPHPRLALRPAMPIAVPAVAAE